VFGGTTKQLKAFAITFPLENYESVAQKDTGGVSVRLPHLF